MTEYIDKATAVHCTDGDLEITGEENMVAVADYIQSVVQRLRQAQGVELIRCKECKHWRSGDGAFGRCYVIHEDEEIGTYKTMMECFAEDFCSWAERQGEQDD